VYVFEYLRFSFKTPDLRSYGNEKVKNLEKRKVR